MSGDSALDGLAVLVHEVRSPTAALAAIAETIGHESLDGAARRDLAKLAIAACHGIERLLRDVAPASIRREVTDVGRLVQETAAAARLSGGLVRASVAPGLPALMADPVRLRQALDNLVANALASSPPETEVVVGATFGDGVVRLTVSDAGQGVRSEEQERIFEAGTRLDLGRPGAGLGLAVVRAIAEAHGGTVDVTSRPGEGATFTISLPAN